MSQLPDSVRQRIEADADLALERAIDGGGFIERPYNRYRYHNGYIAGGTREAERGYKLAEAVRRYRDEPDYTDDLLYIELSAYMKSEG